MNQLWCNSRQVATEEKQRLRQRRNMNTDPVDTVLHMHKHDQPCNDDCEVVIIDDL